MAKIIYKSIIPVALTVGLATIINGSSTYAETAELNQSGRMPEQKTEFSTSAPQEVTQSSIASVQVSTWAEFRNAYNNANVTKIILLNDISFPTVPSLNDRRTSIEIDGGGHTIHQRLGHSLPVNAPTRQGYTPVFHLHNVHLGVVGTTGAAGLDVGGSFSFIQGAGTSTAHVNRWQFRIGNLSTDPRIARVVRAYQAEITLYGNLDIDTRAENFYAGSIIIEDDTVYRGNINFRNYSLIWFPEASQSGTTGAAREFTIGNNAEVTFTKTRGTGSLFPAIFDQWQTITLGENSQLNIDFEGPAFAFSRNNSTFNAMPNSIVNLTRRTNGPVLTYFSELGRLPNNSSFIVESGAELFISGTANGTLTGLINMDTGLGARNHSFVLNNLKSFELINHGTAPVIRNGKTSRVEIIDTDISLWRLGADLNAPADGGTFYQVERFSAFRNQVSLSLNEIITSTDPLLQSTFGSTQQHRKISGSSSEEPNLDARIFELDLDEFEGIIDQDEETITFRIPEHLITGGVFRGEITALNADSNILSFWIDGSYSSLTLGDVVSIRTGNEVLVAGSEIRYSIVIEPILTERGLISRLIIDEFAGEIDHNAATITFRIPADRLNNGNLQGVITKFNAGIEDTIFFFTDWQEQPRRQGEEITIVNDGFGFGFLYVAGGTIYTIIIEIL
jgi:hypothetical protein